LNAIQRVIARTFGIDRALNKTSTSSLEIKAVGDRLPLSLSKEDGKPIFSSWSTEQAITTGMKDSSWVYAAVRKIANAVQSVPWHCEVETASGEFEIDLKNPFQTFLKTPNPYMTMSDLMERITQHLELGGNAYWHVVSNGKVPLELWSLMPDRMKPIPDKTDWIRGYEYKLGSEKTFLEPSEVVHFMFIDPGNDHLGLSPLQAAIRAVQTDTEASKWNKSTLAKRAVKDMIFYPDRPLTKEQYDTYKAQLDATGGSAGARGFLLMSTPGKVETLNLSPVEMDFLQSRGLNRAEIGAVFGVPPVLLNSESASTYNNLSTAWLMLWTDAVIPLLNDIRDVINLNLAPRFGAGIRANYDVSNIAALMPMFEARVKIARNLIETGFPLNAVNRRLQLGFAHVEGGDISRFNLPQNMPTIGGKSENRVRENKAFTWSEEQRSSYWKARDKSRAMFEDVVEKQVVDVFKREAVKVLALLEKNPSELEKCLDAIDDQSWFDTFTSVYDEVGKAYAVTTGRDLDAQNKHGHNPDEVKRFTFQNTKRFRSWVKKTAAEMVKNITDATRNKIKTAIVKALENEQGSGAVVKAIKDLYTVWGEQTIGTPRAYFIARTEVGRAANYGSIEGAKQSEETLKITTIKTWISSRDNRVRDEHVTLDGESVKLEDDFSNGLEYPNEPNCRCVLAFEIESAK
jgi:HK97 family phage portal protein